jgi:hypothetical protein
MVTKFALVKPRRLEYLTVYTLGAQQHTGEDASVEAQLQRPIITQVHSTACTQHTQHTAHSSTAAQQHTSTASQRHSSTAAHQHSTQHAAQQHTAHNTAQHNGTQHTAQWLFLTLSFVNCDFASLMAILLQMFFDEDVVSVGMRVKLNNLAAIAQGTSVFLSLLPLHFSPFLFSSILFVLSPFFSFCSSFYFSLS